MSYALHYTSADDSGADSPWSVYVEQYETIDSPEPIDGLTEKLSTWATEAEAEAEANRLQSMNGAQS